MYDHKMAYQQEALVPSSWKRILAWSHRALIRCPSPTALSYERPLHIVTCQVDVSYLNASISFYLILSHVRRALPISSRSQPKRLLTEQVQRRTTRQAKIFYRIALRSCRSPTTRSQAHPLNNAQQMCVLSWVTVLDWRLLPSTLSLPAIQ